MGSIFVAYVVIPVNFHHFLVLEVMYIHEFMCFIIAH